ncbi:MAG TPA: methylenetetrahydrofolate reductase, partial [Candidatus Bathyarchaeota archaeon]|nr:methylenetetrahydrofolate reductase [Candidatus Bathyarchaeota archaeon]
MSGEKPVYSALMKNIRAGRFVYTGEAEPHKTTDISDIIEAFKALKGWVIAINVTDNPTAYAYMSSLAASYLIQRGTGIEAIYQITCRDRNRLAITADLLGAYALGIRNVLALTGDHPSVGDNPQAKPVFDLDSSTLVYLIRRMVDDGVDLAGNKIEHPPKFHVGIAANPNAEPIEPELLKIERKVEIG